ncbi:PAS domain-containing protein [Gordonia hongkongensis]|uniref:PAS domain-containing protein n=1 Tax=Gordonia hongkongensis TaxID=1701090 RepID=UPI003EBBA564
MSDGFEGAERPSDSDDYQRVATFRFWYEREQWEWSPEAAVLHGYPAAKMTPTTDLLASHKHPEDRASFLAMVEQMRVRHIPFSSRHRIIDTHGQVHPVAVIAHTIRDDTDRAVGTEGFYLDLADYTNDSVQAEVDGHIRAFREHSAVIEQAKGMIMLVYGVPADRGLRRTHLAVPDVQHQTAGRVRSHRRRQHTATRQRRHAPRLRSPHPHRIQPTGHPRGHHDRAPHPDGPTSPTE